MTTPNIIVREFSTYGGDTGYLLIASFGDEELLLRCTYSEHIYEMSSALKDFAQYGDFDVVDIKVSHYRRMVGDETQSYYILCIYYDDDRVIKVYSGFDEILVCEIRSALADFISYMKGEANV